MHEYNILTHSIFFGIFQVFMLKNLVHIKHNVPRKFCVTQFSTHIVVSCRWCRH